MTLTLTAIACFPINDTVVFRFAELCFSLPNSFCRVAFLDVENKDVRKALRLNATVWNGHTITVEEETSNLEQIANYPQSKGIADELAE